MVSFPFVVFFYDFVISCAIFFNLILGRKVGYNM